MKNKSSLEEKTENIEFKKSREKRYGIVGACISSMIIWPYTLLGSIWIYHQFNLPNLEKNNFNSFKEGLYVVGPVLATALALTIPASILSYYGGKSLARKIHRHHQNQEQKFNLISASQNPIQP